MINDSLAPLCTLREAVCVKHQEHASTPSAALLPHDDGRSIAMRGPKGPQMDLCPGPDGPHIYWSGGPTGPHY